MVMNNTGGIVSCKNMQFYIYVYMIINNTGGIPEPVFICMGVILKATPWRRKTTTEYLSSLISRSRSKLLVQLARSTPLNGSCWRHRSYHLLYFTKHFIIKLLSYWYTATRHALCQCCGRKHG